MAALDISPEAYYDLSATETAARLKGVTDRKVDSLRETRLLATLIRNANFQNPVTEREFMPLPGDEEWTPGGNSAQDNARVFSLLADAMGVTAYEETNES